MWSLVLVYFPFLLEISCIIRFQSSRLPFWKAPYWKLQVEVRTGQMRLWTLNEFVNWQGWRPRNWVTSARILQSEACRSLQNLVPNSRKWPGKPQILYRVRVACRKSLGLQSLARMLGRIQSSLSCAIRRIQGFQLHAKVGATLQIWPKETIRQICCWKSLDVHVLAPFCVFKLWFRKHH